MLCSMKLRVRINKRTIRVELPGEDPTVAQLTSEVKDNVLPSSGLSSETQFSLSLNGSELLRDSGQTLSSCGIVPGDLLSVLLPQTSATNQDAAASPPPSSSTASGHNAPMTSSQPSSRSPAPPAPQPERQACVPVWEPMLCSEALDGQTPLSLERLWSAAAAAGPSDALMVAAHLLMTESGFDAPQAGEAEMPVSWRSGGVYKLQYTHPLCGDSVVTLSAVCMGAVLIINVLLKVEESVLSFPNLSLDPSCFVSQHTGQSAASVFKDLSKLSRVFKDQLVNPVIAAAREAWCLPVVWGLTALPPELLLRVLRLLDLRSLLALGAACRHLRTAAADSSLWRHLFRRDFPGQRQDGEAHTDWRQLYVRCYERRREQRHFQRHFHVDPRHMMLPPPASIIPPPLPPLPGIIGGEYDQRPQLPPGLLPRPRYDPVAPQLPPGSLPRPRYDPVAPQLPPGSLPRLRYDPVAPHPAHFRQPPRPPSGGSADARRGFI